MADSSMLLKRAVYSTYCQLFQNYLIYRYIQLNN